MLSSVQNSSMFMTKFGIRVQVYRRLTGSMNFLKMPFQTLLKNVVHPQNNTNEIEEIPGAQLNPGASYLPQPMQMRIREEDFVHPDNTEIVYDSVRKDFIFMKNPWGDPPTTDQLRAVGIKRTIVPKEPGAPPYFPGAGPMTQEEIDKVLKMALERSKLQDSLRPLRPADLKPEPERSFLGKSIASIMASFSVEDTESFGKILQSEAYFWISKAIEAAFATPAHYALIMNSIIVRYANQIFSKDGPVSKFSEMIMTGFEKLVSVIGGLFRREAAPNSPILEEQDEIKLEGFADNAAGFFSKFSGRLSHLLKYMGQQNVLIDLIRIVAIALLGSFTFIFGDRDAFTWTNVELMVRHAMRLCTEGTIGSLTRVLAAIYGIFRDYLTGTTTSDFSEFLKSNTQQTAMQELVISLKARIAAWGSLTVDEQQGTLRDWTSFEYYCDMVLGRARGWASGKRILDSKTLLSFQTAYYTMQIFANNINLGSLREQPFCLAFIGPSSLGKTTLMDMVNQLVLRHLGVKDVTASTFHVCAEGDHMDGATNGKMSFIMDDLATKHPNLTQTSGGDQQLAILVRLLNNIPYFPVMAALEDKGVVCCKPAIVILSSNEPTLGIEHTYINPTIVERRVKYWVQVLVHPDFANATGTLCSDKMRAWSKANPGKVADAWILKVVVKTAASGADGKMYTQNQELNPMSTPAFLKFILDEFIEHQKIQASVLEQAGIPYDFTHIAEHGDKKKDETLKFDYEKPDPKVLEASKTYASFLKRPEKPERSQFRFQAGRDFHPRGPPPGRDFHRRAPPFRRRDVIEHQSGADTVDDHFYSDSFSCPPTRVRHDGWWWIPILSACGVLIGYLSSADFANRVDDFWEIADSMANNTRQICSSAASAARLSGIITNRYSRAMEWVRAGLDSIARIARAVAPFVAAATAIAGAYYLHKTLSQPSDEIILEGGENSKKRRSPDPTGDVPMEDVLLLSTILTPPSGDDISYEPGAAKVYRTVTPDVQTRSREVLLPGPSSSSAMDAPARVVPAHAINFQDPKLGIVKSRVNPKAPPRVCAFSGGEGGTKPTNFGEWVPHPNDKVTSYSDGQPKYGDCPVPHPPGLLSQQSMSVKGFDLANFVMANSVELLFRSSPYNELGVLGTVAGIDTTTTVTFKGRALFYRGKELVTSEHYLPWFHPERANSDVWKNELWTMTIKGAGDTGGDVVMTADEVKNSVIRVAYKDAVRILIKKARSYKNIVPYFLRQSLPSNVAEVRSIKEAIDKGDPKAQTVIGAYQYLPPRLPIGLCARDGISPVGVITETTVDCMDPPTANSKTRWMIHSRAFLDVPTRQGDCASAYFSQDNGIWKAIVGIHTGVVRMDPRIKIITPLCQEDFLNREFALIDPAAAPLPLPPGATLQDAIDIRITQPFEGKWSGPQVLPGIFVQHMPPVKATPWAKRTEDWVKDTTGFIVNPDSYAVLGARDGISGNLASEYNESPLREFYAKADWTGLPGPIVSDKCVPNINRSKRNQATAQNLGQIMAQATYNEELAAEFMEAAESYLESIFEHDVDEAITKTLFEYDMQTTINGHRMEGGGVSKATTPIAMKTSAGLPFSESAGISNKVPWFIVDPEGNHHMGEQLEDAFNELRAIMAKYKEGEDKPKVIFKTALKDEVLAAAKLDSGNIRFILVCPIHATLLTRKMLLCLCRTMALNPFVFGACVGVDATSAQWKQLRDFLTEHGQFTFDGDYKGFDKALIEEITKAVKHVILALLRKSGNYDAESLNIVRNLLDALMAPIVDVFGILYFFRSLNSSGNPLTTQINCIANMLLIWLAFIRRVKRNTGDKFDLRYARELFRAIIRAITYGDDNVISTKYASVFSCRIMAEELRDIITYTDAQKSVVPKEFTDPKELMFLGRSLGEGPPKLEFKRIAKMLTHYRKLKGIDFAGVVTPIYRNVLMEASFHGRDVFERLRNIIVAALGDHFNLPPNVVVDTFLSHKDGPLDYEFFEQWYEGKAHSDALVDPRFDQAKVAIEDDADQMAAVSWYEWASDTILY